MPRLKKKSKSKFSSLSKKQLIPMVAFIAIAGTIFTYLSLHNHAFAAATFISERASGRSLNEGTDPLFITDNPNSFYHYTVVRRGTVSDANEWPFTHNHGYNRKYAGKPIVIFASSNGLNCIGVDYSNYNLDNWHASYDCGPNGNNKTLWWVENGGYLISVGATNNVSTSEPTPPQIMTANCNSTGCRVLTALAGSESSGQQNWYYN